MQLAAPSDDMCADYKLSWDPWPLVSYDLIRREFTTCPFVGGYNMKVLDVSSRGEETGCNFMKLPMRLKSITAEGLIFDLSLSYCLGELPIEVL
jgi:hypothetical protein